MDLINKYIVHIGVGGVIIFILFAILWYAKTIKKHKQQVAEMNCMPIYRFHEAILDPKIRQSRNRIATDSWTS